MCQLSTYIVGSLVVVVVVDDGDVDSGGVVSGCQKMKIQN